MKYITLWHGGRNLESDYTEFKPSRKNRWEYGPGLYLSTHYDRALSYSKGNGKTYQVKIEEGNDIKDISIDVSLINEFISNYVTKSKQKQILEDIYNNMKRMNTTPLVKADIFLNLIINHDGIIGSKTKKLNEFLVDNNIDYALSNFYSGRDESIVVVFNNKKIKSVKHFPAKDVSIDDYILTTTFKDEVNKKPSL